MTTITLPPDIETPLAQTAQRLGTTPESLGALTQFGKVSHLARG